MPEATEGRAFRCPKCKTELLATADDKILTSTLAHGHPGVLHGTFSYVLQDQDGQTAPVHSVSAGLDYPGVGPEHSYWKDSGRVRSSYHDSVSLMSINHSAASASIRASIE